MSSSTSRPRDSSPILDAYFAELALDGPTGSEAYLFHPQSSIDRPVESSAWSMFIRRLFGRLMGKAWFQATIVGFGVAWPPKVNVRYTATADGDQNPQLLPSPPEAKVGREQIRLE